MTIVEVLELCEGPYYVDRVNLIRYAIEHMGKFDLLRPAVRLATDSWLARDELRIGYRVVTDDGRMLWPENPGNMDLSDLICPPPIRVLISP